MKKLLNEWRSFINESKEEETASVEEIEEVILAVLKKEGGAVGLEPIEDALKKLGKKLPEDFDLKAYIEEMPKDKVEIHDDGDVIDTSGLGSTNINKGSTNINKGSTNINNLSDAELLQRLLNITTAQRGTTALVDIKNLKDLARENNLKYFGNEAGQPSAEWQSSITSPRRYNKKLNFILGSIPYKGDTINPVINPIWIQDNIIPVNSEAGNYRINKHLAESLAAAIAESRAKYGLPLKNAGGFHGRGIAEGMSSHAWGAAIDFDHLVNPHSDSEGTLPPRLVKQAKSGENGTSDYWNFTNELAGLNQKKQTWKQYLDSLEGDQRAISLYEFVAGPLKENGIGAIFKKHGWSWGGHYRGRKDGMHFEFLGQSHLSEAKKEAKKYTEADVRRAIGNYKGKQVGVKQPFDFGVFLDKMAKVESRYNPYATSKSGTFIGAFQLGKAHHEDNKDLAYNPARAAAYLYDFFSKKMSGLYDANKYLEDAVIKHKLGEPTLYYLAHNQGKSGAVRIFYAAIGKEKDLKAGKLDDATLERMINQNISAINPTLKDPKVSNKRKALDFINYFKRKYGF